MAISIDQVALNLAVALGLSAVIGFERQWRNRLAGLTRTEQEGPPPSQFSRSPSHPGGEDGAATS